MQGPDKTSIYFHRKYLEELTGNRGVVMWFWIRVDDPAVVPRVVQAIDAKFENSAYSTRSMTEKQFQVQFMEMMGNVRLFMRIIGLAILFTIILIASNAISMSVRERATEVAVLRALGFSKPAVAALLGGEIAAISYGGALLGAGGAFLIYNVAGFDGGGWLQNFTVPADGALLAAGAATIITICGFVPVAFAVRRSIVDGLRRVA